MNQGRRRVGKYRLIPTPNLSAKVASIRRVVFVSFDCRISTLPRPSWLATPRHPLTSPKWRQRNEMFIIKLEWIKEPKRYKQNKTYFRPWNRVQSKFWWRVFSWKHSPCSKFDGPSNFKNLEGADQNALNDFTPWRPKFEIRWSPAN